MEVDVPATPTEAFEIFDGGIESTRKRRRSSLRRVSFADQPSIHVFARDDDYETPPEGTMSHVSTPSTSSPQRRSERLRLQQGDENGVDKENAAPVSNARQQSRRGRRPLAVRDMQQQQQQKERAQDEFLKPSNWLDDHENSAFGSGDDNTGPVDIRHITFEKQSEDRAEDDMTMDSQTFHTRMSMFKQQPLLRLSESTLTPGWLSDMESIHEQHTEKFQAWHERQAALGSSRPVLQPHEEPTWHRGDGRVSDMSEASLDELSILRILAKKRTAAKESSTEDGGNRLFDMDDDAISISPQSAKSLGDEMELDLDTTSNKQEAPERLLSTPNENTESMVITLAWNERAPPQHTTWVDKDQSMDMSDVDTMERYQEGITEAMPKLDSVLGGYECDSPSAEPLSRILQRKSSAIDGEEDSPVYGVTAETEKKAGDVAPSGGLEEKERIPAYRGLEDGTTDEFHFNTGGKRSGFQNPEDTFSFRGHRKNTRETSVSSSMEQNATNSEGQERMDVAEANLSVPQNPGQSFFHEDSTGEYTGRVDWRAEVSSDMSTTPMSPRGNYLQRLGTKAPSVLADSPSFQDGITAAIPNVQDLLDADARTPASELGWNPRKIDWGAQESTRKVLSDEEGLRQPGIDQIEDETIHSMPDRLCTPPSQAEKNHAFEDMTEMAADTLHQVSHSKEIRNSVASKMLLRMMSLQDDARAQPDEDLQQSLRRTLQFQPETDSQLQSQSLVEDYALQRMDPDGAMDVESLKDVDEETISTESDVESRRQESRRQELLQKMQVAEERLLALERRSEELRDVAKDCHKVIAERCQNDSCYKADESPAFCSQTHVCELKKRCQLLSCMLGSDLQTTKTGDSQVLHEFRYWSLLTHSISERKENQIQATASRILIDLNEESINQLFRDMNASLAWRWFLSENEERVQPQSLFYHAQVSTRFQGVNFKVVMLMELMEEVNKCRKYLVMPHFRLQEGGGLHVGLQFSNSELLFDFLLLLDMRQVNHMRYATQRNQKLDCVVEMESAGRWCGRKISEAEIKSVVASVVPGRQLLLRVCASIDAHIMRNLKE